jgi:hypothetical protein
VGYHDSGALGLDDEATAYHEAGHAVAATLCAVGWTEIRLVESESARLETGCLAWVECVDEHLDETTAANRAFIAWAGAWAEARYLSPDDPWRALLGTQWNGGAADMERVEAYWNDPDHAPHDTEEQWARELDSAWPLVEDLAERLIARGGLLSPWHPDWEALGA